jgi:methionyl-tRNA formyltransferase
VRVIFFGTPDFAVPSLEALVREHEIALVVTQPDKPAGRGMKMAQPPVAERAREFGFEIAQPAKIRDATFLKRVEAIGADIAVVIAYGKILPKQLLAIPRHGFVNVHGSILPKYRGAAPIQRAIEAGETTTGVSIMRVDEELDHGPVLAIETVEIAADERAPSVSRGLAAVGGELLAGVLREMSRGNVSETPQDHGRATWAPKIAKREGLVTFSESPVNIYNRFRAFDPWPGVFFETEGEAIRILEMEPADVSAPPRTIVGIDDGVVVDGLRLTRLQRPGKSSAPAANIARALGWQVGAAIP